MTLGSRRQVLMGALGITIGQASAPHWAWAQRPLELADPNDSLYAVVKLRGDIAGGRVLQWYTGALSVLVPGRMPVAVASYQGLIRTDWAPQADGSFTYRTFDLGYFGDLATGEPVESLTNPVTGEAVRPTLIEDGPIERVYSARGIYDAARGTPAADAQLEIPWQQAGDHIWYTAAFGFEYDNPLPPAEYPDLSSTEKVVQRSRFTYRGRRSELEDETLTRASGETIMLVASTIHPWLGMGAFGGFQQIQTVAQKIASIDDVPESYRAFLERTRPGFVTAETPFVGAGNSFERYKQDRLGLSP